MMKQKAAVIIGGGLGGLAAALRLAALGWRVTVCEQGERFGGKMNLFEAEGFRFDTGPSLITMPWIFAELFTAAGSRMEDHLQLLPMHPLTAYSFADGTRFTYTSDLPTWLETVRQLEPRDVDGFLQLMTLGARLYELAKNGFLRKPPLAAMTQKDFASLRYLPLRRAWGNYAKVVAAHLRSPQLRQLYNRYPTYVGSSPHAAPAMLLLIPYLEYAFNGWYAPGGLYRIVESLLDLARQHRVTLLTNAKVRRIEQHYNHVTAVQLDDGRRLSAEVVVANCEAADAKVMLGEPGATRLRPADRSLSGLVFLWGVKRNLRELQHHQVYFSADYP
ncbi:MAG: phytoene desaturase family protein, partial [Blastocatellia bacterium]